MNPGLRQMASVAAMAVAITLLGLKAMAYIVTDSMGVMASLLDSSVDLLASGVTYVAIRTAMKPADDTHRFGHGKAEPLAALAQSAFTAGSALFLLVESLHRLSQPVPVSQTAVGVAVLAVSCALTIGLTLFQRYVVKQTGSVAIAADNMHYAGDLWLNLAVLIGLVGANVTGRPWLDVVLGMAVAVWLCWGAGRIAIAALDLLMDKTLPPAVQDEIMRIVTGVDGAMGVHDMRTRSTGTQYHIEFHLEMAGNISLFMAHEIAESVEAALRLVYPDADIVIHQDPHEIYVGSGG